MRTIPLFALAAALLVAPRARAAEPTARDLIARAPVVSSADAGIKTIEAAGYWSSEGKITETFRALYQAPDHFAFLVSDGPTGIPITYTVDRRTLVYDPVRPELVLFEDAMGFFECHVEDGKPKSALGHKLWTRDPDHIVIDFKHMFEAPDEGGAAARETVVRTGERQYTLIQRRKTHYLRSRVDLSRGDCPFTTLEFAAGPHADPYFCVDKVVVNGGLSADGFAFPPLERTAGVKGFRVVKDEDLGDAIDAARLMLGTSNVRDRLRKESAGWGLIGPARAAGKLARVEEHDRTIGDLIGQMVPAGPPHALAGRPAKKDDPDTIRQTTFETVREHLPRFPIKLRIKIH